jgi:dTDP-4-amino-4,6-dideoxygalactose transaminase
MIYYGKQNINQDDIDSVIEVLKSDFLTQGPKVPEFEEDLKKYCQAKYSKVVSNATSALHLAYLAVGLQKGDIVWTSPNTFVSTANAALYCGATGRLC